MVVKKRSHHKKIPKRSHHKKILKVIAPVGKPVLLFPESYPTIEEPIVLYPEFMPEKEVIATLKDPSWLAKAWKWILE